MARVLLIDDNEEYRQLLKKMIVAGGHEVLTPPVGKALLDALRQDCYDLVVTDVIMPGIDGVEAIRALRATRPDCPIIAMSGGSPNMPAELGLKLTQAFGADLVLYKPFRSEEVLGAIDRLLSEACHSSQAAKRVPR